MALLTKEQINEIDDRPTLEVEIPEWGGSVLIRTLSAAQVDDFGASMLDKNGNATKLQNLHARFAALVLVNEDRSPMYTEQQTAQLGNKSAKSLTRVWDAGRKFNKMDAGDVESAEENSEAAQSGSSLSDSPSPSDVPSENS